MFYEGSLQTGISSAVDQQKLVLCFVTNDNEESQQWEDEFLQDDSLSDLLKNHVVALKLEAGSEEAGYLGQIIPLPQTPTVVIMKHGELKEYIAAGTTKDEFIRRVENTFNSSSNRPISSGGRSAPVPPPAPTPDSAAPIQSAESEDSTSAAPSAQTSTSENVRRILAERAARLQAQKEIADRKEKEELIKKKAKAKAEAESGVDSQAARSYQQAELVKKKKLQASEERQRILKRIEDDKAERKLRAAEREQQRIDSLQTGDVASSLVSAPQSKMPSTSKIGAMTSLQVRLFDGSTMRYRFKTDSSVKDVRKWVNENSSGDKTPFTFRQVLTPLPNKAIDVTEEGKTLGDLGLAPSSTLILVPVQSYSSAYDGGSRNIFSRIFALILGFFGWLVELLGLAGGSGSSPQAPSRGSGASTDTNPSRARGNRSLDERRRDHQLYNGNSLNFEPRPDEDK